MKCYCGAPAPQTGISYNDDLQDETVIVYTVYYSSQKARMNV